MGYLLLILSWSIFYFTHSFLASAKLKRILKGRMKDGFKWYRFSYTIFSSLFFLVIMVQSILIPPNRFLPQTTLMTYLGYMIAAFGTIILVKSTKQIQMKEFLGLEKAEESPKLIQTGLYARVRHPLYLGLLMIFLGYVLVSAQYTALIHFLCLILYLPFGIYFEEKNLIGLFGEKYKEYQKQVPTLFPRWGKKKRA
ncbi:isoprenylcysteine carboxylmethyltransferase family protein [Algoriphagus sp.]|uniref:methyltransferase family protein n=1 Tax=Algoriphagus sp. TaxID=1872435 RepID=UPI0025CBB1C0|nr:isoprenylcysteine carboxylmethyltransferase family protein [Algoriphagus sp.]